MILQVIQHIFCEISISFIQYEIQTSIENNMYFKTIQEKSFWLNGDGLKFTHYGSYEKKITKMNTTSESMTYLVDNKKSL